MARGPVTVGVVSTRCRRRGLRWYAPRALAITNTKRAWSVLAGSSSAHGLSMHCVAPSCAVAEPWSSRIALADHPKDPKYAAAQGHQGAVPVTAHRETQQPSTAGVMDKRGDMVDLDGVRHGGPQAVRHKPGILPEQGVRVQEGPGDAVQVASEGARWIKHSCTGPRH